MTSSFPLCMQLLVNNLVFNASFSKREKDINELGKKDVSPLNALEVTSAGGKGV